MKDERNADWRHVVFVDNYFRNGNNALTAAARGKLYIHKSCVPLDEVDLSNPADHGQIEMFDVCDSGYCYV